MRRLAALSVGCVMGLAGCESTEPSASIAGTYVLHTVGGTAPPVAIAPPAAQYDSAIAIADTVRIDAATRYADRRLYLVARYASSQGALAGTWSAGTLVSPGLIVELTGDSISMLGNGSVYVGAGVVGGGMLAVQWTGSAATYTYHRQ